MITDSQMDAVAEVINIGFARAASALSEITGARVLLDAPQVAIYPINEVSAAFKGYIDSDVATVHQIFTGPVAGDALLILDLAGASQLARLMTNDDTKPGQLDTSDREVLMEIGNILLNACLGTFGNLLHVRIAFAVPRLQLDSLDDLLTSLVIGSEELRYGVVAFTSFRLRDSAIAGYLVVVLGVASLDRLFQEIDQLG